ncbi:MAG: hypothetical protein L3J41_04675 [Melioribacteraceae bacterium]|nr:hypothetical protein [Melioribacteraceae bacterium]
MNKKTTLKQIISIFAVVSTLFFIQCTSNEKAQTYFVDSVKGSDLNSGSPESPFESLNKALEVVNERVERGIRSDKIILRGGVYKTTTIYKLNLKGTSDDYAMISAMPCPPNSENGVQRKGGQWYEKVVFDDGYLIKSEWTQLEGNPHIWKTKIIVPKNYDDSFETALFTMAPDILLQDGVSTIWADKIIDMINPGMCSYNYKTGTLYISSFEDKDPNNSKIEVWYSGLEEYDKDVLLLSGDGRALFNGDLDYATIRGFDFRMITVYSDYTISSIKGLGLVKDFKKI